MSELAVDFEEIAAAQARSAEFALKTPLLTNHVLDRRVGGRIFIKAENFQRTGSFKFRGAINRLLAIPKSERQRGVVAFSSGNHALAVAEAARILDIPAAVIMPCDAPAIKITGAKSRDAEVILYDRTADDREAIAASLIERRGAVLVPPFDDPLVIAGQGVGAFEAIEQLSNGSGIEQPDQVIICCSGGGLASGWSALLHSVSEKIAIFTVEPAGLDDMARSLASGRWESNDRAAETICDALRVSTPGKLTLPVLLARGAKGLSVSDSEVLHAVLFAFTELKLVLEPSGAAALAAVLAQKIETCGRDTLVVASGGNVDQALLANIVTMRAYV
ncbi:threonine/serine dehydratase [Bradyrhizobium sp. CCBAU 53421]|uniref:threonine ammonia-lyase n=1 Tax=Bradyrhizobium sp. CCBAU 53421 TaxID=1325120 RepID=UPI001889EA2A|nr:threonine/serine dehydratase [Bradyrhizobium sp. CCBAU 53421]QOZ32792.1 pyridoxal-5'-phosphate-dependent protein [Bradyrhizobium sp. CCBAU 53421]